MARVQMVQLILKEAKPYLNADIDEATGQEMYKTFCDAAGKLMSVGEYFKNGRRR